MERKMEMSTKIFHIIGRRAGGDGKRIKTLI